MKITITNLYSTKVRVRINVLDQDEGSDGWFYLDAGKCDSWGRRIEGEGHQLELSIFSDNNQGASTLYDVSTGMNYYIDKNGLLRIEGDVVHKSILEWKSYSLVQEIKDGERDSYTNQNQNQNQNDGVHEMNVMLLKDGESYKYENEFSITYTKISKTESNELLQKYSGPKYRGCFVHIPENCLKCKDKLTFLIDEYEGDKSITYSNYVCLNCDFKVFIYLDCSGPWD